MSFPSDPGWTTLTKNDLNAGTDSPAAGRVEIEALVDRINAMQTIITQMINFGTPLVASGNQTLTGSLTVTGDIIGKGDVKAYQP
jgi:hypothetical protein